MKKIRYACNTWNKYGIGNLLELSNEYKQEMNKKSIHEYQTNDNLKKKLVKKNSKTEEYDK